jgi:4'-phosphopantetheinyl transferase
MPPCTVELYYTSIDAIAPAHWSAMENALPVDVRLRIAAYQSDTDRKLRIASKHLLAHAFKQRFLLAELPVQVWQQQERHWEQGGKRIHFSTSYSDRLCAVALCTRAVGIDIEADRPLAASSLEPFLHPNEKQLVHSAPDAPHAMLDLWCKKEALLKAAGIGIQTTLEDVDASGAMGTFRGARFFLLNSASLLPYHCAVAVRDEPFEVLAHRIDF